MAVIQYEKANTHSSDNISICRQGQNWITKVFWPESDWGGQLLKGFDLHSEEDFQSSKAGKRIKISKKWDDLSKWHAAAIY